MGGGGAGQGAGPGGPGDALVFRRTMSLWHDLRRWHPFGSVPEIGPRDLLDALRAESPPVLLDVRTRVEWERSHIAGSVNVSILSLRDRLPAIALDPARSVVAICLSAHRSVPAVRLLRERGYVAAQLAGGMLAWWRAKLPVVEGAEAPLH
jgi:rhodanese-related sulfurtransferase